MFKQLHWHIETIMRLAAFSAVLLLSLIPGQSSRVEAFCCQNTSTEWARSSYVHKVAAFGTDGRRTIEEYARDNGLPVSAIRRRFAATGTIICRSHGQCADNPDRICNEDHEGSAQLTLKADVITTSAHLLADEDSCKIIGDARECTFQVEGPSRRQSIKVEKLLDVGDPFGNVHNHCPLKESYRGDWAIMKLSQPVPDVTPYMIDVNGEQLQKGASVLLTCHSMDFARTGTPGNPTYPKTIESCSVRDTLYHAWGDIIQTDCALASMCSGGSLLSGDNDQLTLRAVTRSSTLSQQELEHAIAEGWVSPRPYDKYGRQSQFVTVSREFLNALRKLEGLPPLNLKTKWDEPAAPVDSSLGKLPSLEELGVKRVGP